MCKDKYVDAHAHCRALGYACTHTHASPTGNGGTHGGELLVHKLSLCVIPIFDRVIQLVGILDEHERRFVACEIRMSGLSILHIAAYLWCSAGWSPRSWSILQKVASLSRFSMICHLFWSLTSIRLLTSSLPLASVISPSLSSWFLLGHYS